MPTDRILFNRKLSLKSTLLVLLGIAAVLGLGMVSYLVIARARSMAHLRASIPILCEEATRQRDVLLAAIENYKRALNVYPPDHLLSRAPLSVDAVTNQLLYELMGTLYDSTNDVFYCSDFPQIRGVDVKRLFNTVRLRNSGDNPGAIGRFLDVTNAGATTAITERPDTVALLSFWPSWQGVQSDLYQQIDIGTWCYNSSAPIHNRSGFDLWIEIKTPLTNILIANW